MKYIRFEHNGKEFYGSLNENDINIIDNPFWLEHNETGEQVKLEDVKLLCPVKPSKIMCVGLNYHKHVKHSQSADEAPKVPLIFMKPPSSLLEPNGKIIYPDNCDRVDYEAELAVVIGKRVNGWGKA